ncbi:FAD-binding oxidoreductase [Exiguobacterium sp. SL14]|nr:FAD-binding oxidoreductase [Exiguobacterium sp. SL14]MCY1691246.1 FAD-binding oxidoreductase [Exiguobacterium sp. SL14]
MISDIQEQADGIRSLTFKTDGPLPVYRAGQYITLRIQDQDGLWHNRQYSLTTASNTTTYTIGVKREGIVSDYLHSARIGDSVLISAPAGAFTLDASGEPVVLIAGGIGITPMLAMAEEALAMRATRDVTSRRPR